MDPYRRTDAFNCFQSHASPKGHYATCNATAKDRASAPAHSFPKAGPRRDPHRLQRGPGHYVARSALESQVLSTKPNAPAVLFGRS